MFLFRRIIVSVCCVILLSGFFFLSPVIAQKSLDDAAGTLGTVVTPTGVPTTGLQVQIGTIIRTILSVVGTIFFVLMIYAGFRWMGARGNEEEIAKAKNTIIAAVIGVVIVLLAYAITVFVTQRLVS